MSLLIQLKFILYLHPEAERTSFKFKSACQLVGAVVVVAMVLCPRNLASRMKWSRGCDDAKRTSFVRMVWPLDYDSYD